MSGVIRRDVLSYPGLKGVNPDQSPEGPVNSVVGVYAVQDVESEQPIQGIE